MIVEVLDTRNVLLNLGTTDSPFNVIVGPGHECMYTTCHLWLLSETVCDMDDRTTLLSGIKVACTYPHSLALSSLIRNSAHVFLSNHQRYPLPFGWSIEPVSSGTSTTNWLFTHNGGHAVLVCGPSSVSPNCLYPPIFRPQKLDLLIHTSRTSVKQSSVSGLISLFHSGISDLRVEDAVSATAVAVNMVHHIAELPTAAQGPVRIVLRSQEEMKSFQRVASLFEWLNRDMQDFLRKCVRYECKWNKDDTSPLALAELLNTGRLCFGSMPEDGDKFVISLSQGLDVFSIVGESSHDELCALFAPISTLTEGSIEYNIERYECSCPLMNEEVFARTVKLRFPNAQWNSQERTITVPSLAAKLEFGLDGKLKGISYSCEEEDLKALVHLVS